MHFPTARSREASDEPASSHNGSISPERVRAQLDKILASPGFCRSPRMQRFLEVVVTRGLDPNGRVSGDLKETQVGIAVFGRDATYDPKSDPIVRVEARRLRAKLQEYYEGAGRNDPLILELPKGGYTPVVREQATAEAPPAQPSKTPVKPRWIRTGAIVATAAALAAALWSWHEEQAESPLTPVPLTSLEGIESAPSFSPEGTAVAFSWDGPRRDNLDVYTQSIGSQQPWRVTRDAAPDFSPRWSPDASRIAFLRSEANRRTSVVIVPAAGGVETKIAESLASIEVGSRAIDWLPDGRSLVAVDRADGSDRNALFELSLESARKRQLTFPAAGQGDTGPSVSPDGRTVSFIRDVGHGVSRVCLLRLGTPESSLRIFAWDDFRTALSTDPAWTPDGRNIIFTSNRGGPSRLWRSDLSGGEPKLLGPLGENVSQPAISARAGLAYRKLILDTSIWRIDLHHTLATGRLATAPVISTTRQEHRGSISPDGTRIAFESDRGGVFQIWVAGIDGSGAWQLTNVPGAGAGSPQWSPDGAEIVFDSRLEGQPEIYSVPVRGGAPRRLTHHAGADILPVYSHDGRWIYFGSNRSGSFQIWRMSANGEDPIQITKGGGVACRPSRDGSFLYFTRDTRPTTSLWRIRSDGTDEVFILSSLLRRSFGLIPTDDRMVFFDGPPKRATVHLLDLRSGRLQNLPSFSRPVQEGLSVSADGRYVYYGQRDQDGSDIAILHGYR